MQFQTEFTNSETRDSGENIRQKHDNTIQINSSNNIYQFFSVVASNVDPTYQSQSGS